MFGYIRPFKPELKVREFEQFKACYCSLCHTLGNEYGFAARFILNYDFVLLAMLLWDKDQKIILSTRKCPACPFKKKKCCQITPALKLSAGYSIILTWWKLCDAVKDERGFQNFKYRLAQISLKHAYKKASYLYPDFNDQVAQNISKLSSIETQGSGSLDEAADCFAKILESISTSKTDENSGRVISQLLYHIGRWIYIVDAYDDLSDDIKKYNYNPIVKRFNLTSPEIDKNTAEYISATINHSKNLAGSAFELMNENAWADIIRNIICLGMPAVSAAVLSGTWKKSKKTLHKEQEQDSL